MLAAATDQFGPNMTNHLKTCRHALQHFGHVLTKITQRPTATAALRVRLMYMDFARKVLRQWLTPRDRTRCRFDGRRQFCMADVQFFKAQLKLVDYCVQLLGTATKLRATKLGDHHLRRSISARWAAIQIRVSAGGAIIAVTAAR